MIESIRQKLARHPRLAIGIGDDAALVDFTHRPGGSSRVAAGCLVTVDMLMEGVDFTIPPATPRQIGWKSLAVNLSDIAAMAGQPVACVVSVALPRHNGFALGQGLMEGIIACADQFGVALAGGDTNTWEGPLVISITVLGEPTLKGPVQRSGAVPGDWIMATGSFGGSIAGKHLDFTPRVAEALALHEAAALHAMIDVSDGLAADLWHILDESRVGAILDAAAIPVSPQALACCDDRSALEHALADGEDFELLFTVSAADGQALLNSQVISTQISYIGQVTASRDCFLKSADGNLTPLPALGWKHGFARANGAGRDNS
ncbi:MAG TPA: thiamine-phosphate kinase [Planctomycetaceae bacterium]